MGVKRRKRYLAASLEGRKGTCVDAFDVLSTSVLHVAHAEHARDRVIVSSGLRAPQETLIDSLACAPDSSIFLIDDEGVLDDHGGRSVLGRLPRLDDERLALSEEERRGSELFIPMDNALWSTLTPE